MKAIRSNVLIDVTDSFPAIAKETITKSGIILPSEPQKDDSKVLIGEVISLGEDVLDRELKIGDKVIVSKFFGIKLKENDKTVISTPYSLIFAKVEEC